MTTFTLRPPQAADYVAIASWIPDATACTRWAGPRLPFPFAVADLPELLAVAGGQSYCLAAADSVACAFGQHWVLSPGAVHLGRIIVSPFARGQGLGRQLCQQLMVRAVAATGAAAVTLRVYRDNAAAHALYCSLGFVPQPESTEELLFMRAQMGSAIV